MRTRTMAALSGAFILATGGLAFAQAGGSGAGGAETASHTGHSKVRLSKPELSGSIRTSHM